jgi:hypothetical protein
LSLWLSNIGFLEAVLQHREDQIALLAFVAVLFEGETLPAQIDAAIASLEEQIPLMEDAIKRSLAIGKNAKNPDAQTRSGKMLAERVHDLATTVLDGLIQLRDGGELTRAA